MKPEEKTTGKVRMKKTAILSRLLPYLLQHKGYLAACVLLTVFGNLLGHLLIHLTDLLIQPGDRFRQRLLFLALEQTKIIHLPVRIRPLLLQFLHLAACRH